MKGFRTKWKDGMNYCPTSRTQREFVEKCYAGYITKHGNFTTE